MYISRWTNIQFIWIIYPAFSDYCINLGGRGEHEGRALLLPDLDGRGRGEAEDGHVLVHHEETHLGHFSLVLSLESKSVLCKRLELGLGRYRSRKESVL